MLFLLFAIISQPVSAGAPIGSFVDVGAFVYDCWTRDDAVWGHHGANWSEWNLVKAATPRFAGHLQPKVPLWGYLDTGLPASWDILTPAAVEHGVTVFMWDFYWFANMSSPVLANGLNKGFLKSSTRNQAKFAIMWANQDWEDIQPAKRDSPRFTQFIGALDAPTFKAMTDYWIANYLTLPNYYRVPDLRTTSPDRVCALINIYMIDTLVDGLGGLDQTASAVADFRARAAAAGVPCIHLQAEGFSLHNVGRKSVPDVIAALGINSVTDYCWQHYLGMSGFPLVRPHPVAFFCGLSENGQIANACALTPPPLPPPPSLSHAHTHTPSPTPHQHRPTMQATQHRPSMPTALGNLLSSPRCTCQTFPLHGTRPPALYRVTSGTLLR
jgi:hypothetical protein